MPKGARRGKSDGQGQGHEKKHGKVARQAAKRKGKAAYLDLSDPQVKLFAAQLEALKLRLHDVPGDGNCLFRALADQLSGDGAISHETVRSSAVQYIRRHEADFSPFMEEGVAFDTYVTKLSRDGEHGGNDAIVAFARHYCVDVLIHQLDLPLWEVRVPGARRQVHIAYLNAEHYCSVRSLLETNPFNVLPSVQRSEVPGDREGQVKGAPKESTASAAVVGWKGGKLESLLGATSCTDLRLAQHCLEECDYDLDAAIAELLQLMDLGATDQLDSNTTGGAEVLPKHEDVGKRSSGSVEEHSSIDQTAAMVPPPPSSTKHSTSPSTNVSRKKLRKEAARRRRAGEKQQQQKPQEPTPTEKEREPLEGSICI